jgi:hypothetical protein
VLAQPHPAGLRVYAVWLPMLATDSRSAWNDDILEGPNVREYWDGDRSVGRALARSDVGGLGFAGVVWDAFILFDRDAAWLAAPGPALASGSPVTSSTNDLRRGLRRLSG